MKPIVVVGSINMDMVSRTARIPSPGETIFGTSFQTHTGGKGANQAVAVAKLGYPVIMLGKVGQDAFGRELVSALHTYGVDMSEVEAVAGSSGAASIVVDDRGENSIIVIPGANLLVDPQYVREKADVLRAAGMVLAQLEIPLETVACLAQMCEEFGVPLVLDPAPAQRLDAATLARIAWFTPNQTEAQFYTQKAGSSDEVLARCFALGPKNIILKQGSDGALIALAGGGRYAVNPFPVETVDTTAAGDAFNGAFAVALLSGLGPQASGQYAAAAAAISVTRTGAQSSLANSNEVQELLNGRQQQANS